MPPKDFFPTPSGQELYETHCMSFPAIHPPLTAAPKVKGIAEHHRTTFTFRQKDVLLTLTRQGSWSFPNGSGARSLMIVSAIEKRSYGMTWLLVIWPLDRVESQMLHEGCNIVSLPACLWWQREGFSDRVHCSEKNMVFVHWDISEFC
ncbi:hypothetical protein [Prosthecochloris sp.]|uniref:hypothetical protein n=1 Tax=Prosthecochloris sp. TaxID=290513 RepID=UPI0025F77CB2|nr:hypothetical protein [Prosthecochloris sp.]